MKNSKTPSPKAFKESKSSPKRTNKQNSPKRSFDAYKGAKTCKETGSIEKQEENYLARCTNFRLTTGYELSICNCKHVRRMTLGERHSIVNPQRWHCNVCYTTESVWACLSCPNVACGRYIQEHALTHFQESGHPLAIDVNELYVFCYKCDDYVLNDNNSSDIKVLRETLQAIRYQNFTGTTRSGHTLRSAMISEQEDLEMRRQMQQQQLDRDDRQFTAIWHSRFVRQRKAFRRWLKYVRLKRNSSSFPPDISSDDDNVTDIIVLSDGDIGSRLIQSIQPMPLEEIVSNQPANPESVEQKRELEEVGTAQTNMKLSTASEQNSENISTEISLLMEDILRKIPKGETGKNFDVENLGNVDCNRSPTDSCANSENMRASSSPPSARTLDRRIVLVPSPKKPLMIITPLSPSAHTKSPISNKDIKLVTVNLPSSSVLKHTLASEKKLDVQVEATKEKTEQEVTKEVKLADLNILSRPKRSTAALKYKEIFGKLLERDERESPAKRARLMKKDEKYAQKPPRGQQKPRRVGMRSSDRLKRINEEKERVRVLRKRKEAKPKSNRVAQTEKARAAALRKRKVMKKATAKARLQKKQHQVVNKSQRSRRLIVNKRISQDRKKSSAYRSHSLYDNVPNRAVTSLIPGVTGLRNLGNTCYLNSIIQVLGHLQKFRRCLLALREFEFEALSQSPKEALYKSQTADGFLSSINRKQASNVVTRRSTVELYEEQTRPQPFPPRKSDRLTKSRSGLNGGQSSNISESSNWDPGSISESTNISDMAGPDHWSPSLSLCNELDHLYRVMWSGKWKLVSPYHFLHSVWSLIPSFRGYTQQDAQEFLCELLDKIVSELERCQTLSATENKLALRILKVVQKVFEGRLMSRVRCLECGHVSQTIEPFWDLSLEFPERYHKVNSVKRRSSTGGKSSCSVPSDPCTLHEMLQNFTAPETLEGGKVYGCVECNFQQYQNTGCIPQKKRLSGRKNAQLLTEAEKQLKVLELPQVIRFHLKRFRWIGRNHREKISVHVEFPPELDMRRYCWNSDVDCLNNVQHMYDLSAVVMHHGRGFGSGHYTANCWNDIGEFWVHCNDSNLELRSIEDVMTSQAYILFYTQRGLDPHPHILSPPPTPKMSPSSAEGVFDSTFSHTLPVEPLGPDNKENIESSFEQESISTETKQTTST